MFLRKYTYAPSIIFIVLFIGFYCQAKAQSMSAAPLVKNYPKQVYHGGTQTWDICEGENGLIFYANNEGLLLFDGREFSHFALPKNTILRSIYYAQNTKRIYAGGQNELGYFEFEKNGNLNFHSLASLLPEGNKGFEDVWGIEELNGNIYFQTSRQVFEYNGQNIRSLKPSENLLENIFIVGKRLLLTDINGGVFEMNQGNFTTLVQASGLDISAILPYGKNDLLLTTYKNGLFILKNNAIVKPSVNEELL